MFLLTLPKGDKQGRCRINGKEAEYQLLDNPKHGPYIIWRYADPEESRHWDRRNVLSSEEITDANDVACTSFMCDDGEPTSGPYVVVKPGKVGDTIVTETFNGRTKTVTEVTIDSEETVELAAGEGVADESVTETHTTVGHHLPPQGHYYVVAKGNQWAYCGPDDERQGFLVFTDEDKAQAFISDPRFLKSRPNGAAEYRPMKISLERLTELVEAGQSLCVPDATGFTLLTDVEIGEPPTCDICGEPLPAVEWGYDSRNAQPVADGRCCPDCDVKVVIPARFREGG